MEPEPEPQTDLSSFIVYQPKPRTFTKENERPSLLQVAVADTDGKLAMEAVESA